MDKELSQSTENTRRDINTFDGNNTPARFRKPGRKQKKREKQPEPIELLVKTVRHFIPGITPDMNRLPDPRKDEQCVYTQAHLLWTGILMFMMHLGSRNQLRLERMSDQFADNLALISGQDDIDTVADPDTLAYYAEHTPLNALEKLLASITTRLIRKKALDPFRLYGYFPIAIDGTQTCTFDYEPWPGCPKRNLSNGKVQYFSYVLDAKLLTPSGMALTLATEFLTNEGLEEFDKQDCELKAFPRLVEKLYQLFPRTPICLLLDGLYANQNVIRLVEAKGWKYIITFKEGSMSERFPEAESLAKMQIKNRLTVTQKKCVQHFSWADQLPIAEFNPNVLFCTEAKMDDDPTRFAWLTNFHICLNNVENIANKGGRLRWKIENEGYKTQKKDGYEMEHAYSRHANGHRVFYILLLIAHYITQLILHSNLICCLAKSFGSAKNFARRLAESFRNYAIPVDLPMPGQIRFQPP